MSRFLALPEPAATAMTNLLPWSSVPRHLPRSHPFPACSGFLFKKLYLHKSRLPFSKLPGFIFFCLRINHAHIQCCRTSQRFVFLFIFISDEAGSNQMTKSKKIIKQPTVGFRLCFSSSFPLQIFVILFFIKGRLNHILVYSTNAGHGKEPKANCLSPEGFLALV